MRVCESLHEVFARQLTIFKVCLPQVKILKLVLFGEIGVHEKSSEKDQGGIHYKETQELVDTSKDFNVSLVFKTLFLDLSSVVAIAIFASNFII